jgi:hypothetical protein
VSQSGLSGRDVAPGCCRLVRRQCGCAVVSVAVEVWKPGVVNRQGPYQVWTCLVEVAGVVVELVGWAGCSILVKGMEMEWGMLCLRGWEVENERVGEIQPKTKN